MNLEEAMQRLRCLGFSFRLLCLPKFGMGIAEPFDFGKNHILSNPYRDVFIGEAAGGWYITSHINFRARRYREQNIFQATIKNIFGHGSTLKEAVADFEKNFLSKTYNGRD